MGYSYLSLLKKSFSVLQSFIVTDFPDFSKQELGAIASSFSIAYALSRLVGGVLSDIFPPIELFCIGLSLASLVHLLLPLSSSLLSFCSLWALNGIVQGLGWPSIAKYIISNFDKDSIGNIWSVTITVYISFLPFSMSHL